MTINAIIYEFIFNPSFDHNLKGIRYIGQTIRKPLIRNNQHLRDIKNKSQEFGYHGLRSQYPENVDWKYNIIYSKVFEDRIEAGEWLNNEERRLIKLYGGPMRNWDDSNQTLNLTTGGQGDPKLRFATILRKSRKGMEKVWKELKQFQNDNGHLRIPTNHINKSGTNLGTISKSIRQHGTFLQHDDFRNWLINMNFPFHMRRNHLDEVVWPAFKKYLKSHNNLNILRDYKDGELNLGAIAHRIRNDECFLHYPDFKKWLDDNNFEYKPQKEHIDKVIFPAFRRFYEMNGDLVIAQKYVDPNTGDKLGSMVNHIRSNNGFSHHNELMSWLRDHDFVFDVRRDNLDKIVWPAFKRYYINKNNLNISLSYIEPETSIKLGNIVGNIRRRGDFLIYPDFKVWLRNSGFKLYCNSDDINEERWKDVMNFYIKTKPNNSKKEMDVDSNDSSCDGDIVYSDSDDY